MPSAGVTPRVPDRTSPHTILLTERPRPPVRRGGRRCALNDTLLGTVIGGVLVSAATAVVIVLNAISKNRLECQKIRHIHENEVIAGLERQLTRMEAQMKEYHASLQRVQEIESDCEVTLADCYGQLVRMHEWGVRQSRELRAAGRDPGPDPAAPERPARQQPRQEAEFVVRTEAQGLAAARGVNERLARDRQDPGSSGT
jgi:hypothetical protein